MSDYTRPRITRHTSLSARRAGSRDSAGAPPTTSFYSCPTADCRKYIDDVDAASKELSQIWGDEAKLAEVDASYPMDAQQKIRFLKDFETWQLSYRVPWLNGIGKLLVDCDSTTTGPCREAVARAEDHEKAIVEWDGVFRAHLKGKVALKGKPFKGIKNSTTSSKDTGALPSFAPSGKTLAIGALALLGLYAVTR